MNIHEYQAKEILARYGVKIPKGRVALNLREVEAVAREIGPGPFVIKAQVHAGGRGKAGGVRIAKDLSEVVVVARGFFGMLLVGPQTVPQGKPVSQLFSEMKRSKSHLAIVLDEYGGTGGLVTIEEHAVDGGLGGAVAECCMDAGIAPAWFLRIGLRHTFSSLIGTQAYQRSAYGLDGEAIAKAVLERLPRGQIRVA